jgi:hypothetical protein
MPFDGDKKLMQRGTWLRHLVLVTAIAFLGEISAAIGQEPAATPSSPPPAAAPATPPAAVPAQPQTPVKPPFELQPYKVEVALVFEDSSEQSPQFRKLIYDEIKVAIDSGVGPMWELVLTSGEWLTPHSSQCVHRMSADSIKPRVQALQLDKLYPIAVESVGSEFRLTGREWDQESQVLSTVRTRATRNRAMVGTEIMRLLKDLFRPVIAVDDGDPTVGAKIRVRAGEFPPADPAFSQAQVGRYYVPFMKSFAKDKSLRKVSFVPWCYLSAKEVNRSKIECGVEAGVRVKFTPKRRTEWRGLGIQQILPSTDLVVTNSRSTARPLVGYFVGVYDEQPKPAPKPTAEGTAEPAPEPKMLALRTDRFGKVTLPAEPSKPLKWVLVRSGKELLTQFPIIPGVEETMSAKCPDDTERLEVEGQMAMVETDLIDTIAKRAVTLSLIKARAKKEEWPRVDQGFAELAALSKYADFERRVNELQYAAIKKTQAKKNVVAEDRIKKLGSKVLEIAKFHLDEEKIDELKSEMDELKNAAASKAELDDATNRLRSQQLK